MAADLSAPPVLSTPDDHFLQNPATTDTEAKSILSDDALRSVYEIPRTVSELRAGGWKRIALQFPDDMLPDAPRVSGALGAEVTGAKLFVLADTSYSACCVDEVAAEHADAEVVVHYGRACLSPTSRLPVIYVYTSRGLDLGSAVERFESEFADKQAKVIIMADLMYQQHVQGLVAELQGKGYADVLMTEVVRDPAGLIPNRRIPDAPEVDEEALKDYSLFHISDPPSSVLLALHSRFASLHVLSPDTSSVDNPTMRTAGLLRRRFARVLSLASAGVVGILVNTLSVANSLASVDKLRRACDAAGKKSYTVVVGRLNPAKLANFAEVEGWVVVGCWEGGLIAEDEGYWRPVVTPFEMQVALMGEEERVWGGEWWGGIEKLKLEDGTKKAEETEGKGDKELNGRHIEVREDDDADDDGVEGDESLPPEFDLRTGKLVSHSRPMHLTVRSARQADKESGGQSDKSSEALIKRSAPGELASINGVASPGAEFLRSQRTWQGLGSDFAENQETSTAVEEGRSGIARGYHVGDDDENRH
ncbi:Diphthamide biosynthesis protein-like protein [Hapsidospora chrysogenum ATCC 11550]|uniref:2-(3-amino-3-carboxypropyl)histidine synthase subunit 2 n=1 Tax=Hapsidospora chrysogenum (strain ATCC 11550 / CBS 779.69 / DSM 880 / IAM 14645 / JCM 23072 / IMI 49137) TaxID=857340 RepID=A0A086TDB3_HAPC1|nr:Diphthamide biosynthesis protein-like protein [Hapsidospora chrysogenum ATCC 11550]